LDDRRPLARRARRAEEGGEAPPARRRDQDLRAAGARQARPRGALARRQRRGHHRRAQVRRAQEAQALGPPARDRSRRRRDRAGPQAQREEAPEGQKMIALGVALVAGGAALAAWGVSALARRRPIDLAGAVAAPIGVACALVGGVAILVPDFLR